MSPVTTSAFRPSHAHLYVVIGLLTALLSAQLYLSSSGSPYFPSSQALPSPELDAVGPSGNGAATDSVRERLESFAALFPPIRSSLQHGYPQGIEQHHHHVPADAPDRPLFDWPSIKTMFVFGDSFTTNYQWRDMRPGQVGDGRPETHWHLDHRMTDRTWADWLWGLFKDTRTTKYFNIARPGATISWDILPPGQKAWGTFENQTADFEEWFAPQPGPPGVDWTSESTLFLFFFGINDISQLDRVNPGDLPFTVQEACRLFAESLFVQNDKLYHLGARNFVFLNAHPFYRSPKYFLPHGLGHDIIKRVIESVDYFNLYFAQYIAEFRQRHTDANVYDLDIFKLLDFVLDYPEMFGLTETERYEMRWEGDEEEPDYGKLGFAFRDFQHPSWSTQLIIARALNGLLLRNSASFQRSNETEDAILVDSDITE